MPEEKAVAIAENADMVLNGYAVTRDGGNFRVVNLRSGKAAYVMGDGKLSEKKANAKGAWPHLTLGY